MKQIDSQNIGVLKRKFSFSTEPTFFCAYLKDILMIKSCSVQIVRQALDGKGGQWFVIAHIKFFFHSKSMTGRGLEIPKKNVTYYSNAAAH